jgi:hypothetical protein
MAFRAIVSPNLSSRNPMESGNGYGSLVVIITVGLVFTITSGHGVLQNEPITINGNLY